MCETDNFCRICYENDLSSSLISSICECRGSNSKLHLPCLTSWLKIKRSDICEICRTRYKNVRLKKSQLGFFTFIKEDQRQLENYLLFAFFVFVYHLFGWIVCKVFISEMTRCQQKNDTNDCLMLTFFIFCVAYYAVVIPIVSYSLCGMLKNLYKEFMTWKETHFNIEVVFDGKLNVALNHDN